MGPTSGTDGLRGSVCVFAPSLILVVTIEAGGEGSRGGDVHLHPGGQGFWIARLIRQLGCRSILCAPTGGEAGLVLAALVPEWDVDLQYVKTASATPCFVDDRRSGSRRRIAEARWSPLHRHDADDLYEAVIRVSVDTGTCVITGRHPGDRLPVRFFARLGADLLHLGVTVIGDLHGEELDAFLEHGALSVLKVSDEDLVDDGFLPSTGEEDVIEAVRRLAARAIEWVVVSRAEKGAVVSYGGEILRASPPVMSVVDASGAGDSMTAAIVASRVQGLGPDDTIRLGCAAGAANVTRHGLGSASAELIARIAPHVRIERIGAVT